MRRIIKRKNLVESVVELFLDKLNKGEIGVGRLPSQEVLASEFNVSRIVLREALNQLHAMGIIEVLHGKGTFVLEEEKRELISQSASSKLFFQNKKNLLYTLECRLILETETVGLASQRANLQQITRMETLLLKMDENISNYDQFEIYDLEFHLLIAEASGNPMLKEITSFVENGYRMAPTELFKIPGVLRKAHDEHKNIFKAIKERDDQKAKEYMKAHLSFPQQILSNI